ncbi:MAG: hypothetical protein LBD60_03340 [Puniceicoccales bacterium]|jgi:hypothetical protein|nr:hypothetical protein [Puniceicoccales bacterium]
MKKSTKTTGENQVPEEDVPKTPPKRKIHQAKKLTETVDEHWEYEENEPRVDTRRKKKIRQADDTKKMTDGSWSTVPHTPLFSRKVTTGNKIKSKSIQIQKITTVKKFFQKNPNLSIEKIPLTQRKAKQIDLFSQTLPQVIKTTLKDYNSIHFRVQAS